MQRELEGPEEVLEPVQEVVERGHRGRRRGILEGCRRTCRAALRDLVHGHLGRGEDREEEELDEGRVVQEEEEEEEP